MLPQIKDAGAADSVNGDHFSSAENSTTRLRQLKTINIKKNEKEKMKIQMLNLTDKMIKWDHMKWGKKHWRH